MADSTSWSVRVALLADRPRLRDIFRRAALSNKGDRDALRAHPEGLVLPDVPLDEGHVLVVADEFGEAVGFATLLTSDAGLELEDLFVDPDWMRRGVATALMNEALELARREGVSRIEVTGNTHALEFYKSAGFVTDSEVTTPFGGVALRMHLDARTER